MSKEIVRFVSAKPYLTAPIEVVMKLLLCLHGRKEVVVLCSDELRQTLMQLPSDYLQPRMKDIQAYLDEQGIEYVVGDLKGTSKV